MTKNCRDPLIRNVNREEMQQMVDWAASEGWNPGLHDAGCFYQTDPDGYFMAYDGDEVIGAISAVAYDATFGFIGFYIVRPDYRGHRVGLALGQTAMTYLGPRNIGVDGVENKVKNYETYGFKLAYHNIRFEGTARRTPHAHACIKSVGHVPFDALRAYDDRHFPVPRPRFLRAWVALPDARCLVWADHDGIQGYGMIRACLRGYKVGPLFANRPEIAKQLFIALQNDVQEGAPVFLDAPEPNDAAMRLVADHAMRRVFGTARMYNKAAPDIPLQNIFGVTTFELG
ncbi:MAG: GNAT family N-acetyltransferase [Spartobacteria bacterium]|nr:GNAT family N-acetyltransferase [Spartobacteria bacterium]